jgi:Protein of unknown function (DUF2971)
MIEETEPQRGNYLERLRAQMASEQVGLVQGDPPMLYHYTASDGLLGIIETDSIYATNFRYVNDLTEFTYANDLLRNELSRTQDNQNIEVYGAFRHILQSPEMLLAGTDLYLACFCEDGDLLSQWRAYGSRGGGYALGFRASAANAHKMNPRKSLYRVTYDEEQQVRLLRFLVEAYKRDIIDSGSHLNLLSFQKPAIYPSDEPGSTGLKSGFGGSIGELTIELAQAFVELACGFKNSHFKEEREWRLVHRGHVADSQGRFNIQFRTAGSAIIPYVKIELLTERDGLHPGSRALVLERINFGPGLNPTATHEALKLLTSRHFMGTEIAQSKIKVRV